MTLAYQEYGDRKASLIVFLHGGGVSSWMWDKQIDYFAHYHCMTIDLPEHGASKDNKPFTIQSCAEEVTLLIGGIASGKEVILVGFSLGAQVALQILTLSPKLIQYAMINSALVQPQKLLKIFVKPSLKLTYPLIKVRAFSKLQAKQLYIDETYFERFFAESKKMKLETLGRVLEENLSFNLAESFTEVESEILVTVGNKEKGVMKRSARDIVSKNANGTGVILPNTGHGLSFLNPNLFNLLMDNWLQNKELPKEVVVDQLNKST